MARSRKSICYALAVIALGEDCRPHMAPAERYYGLPPGLLSAVAMVESGHGGIPYPWALNIGGQAVMAPDFASAARMLRGPDGVPRRDVAVGCMQIYMNYHLDRFQAPEWALVPRNNVWYGAYFLRELKERYGDWRSAVAHYHASNPAAQRDYLSKIGRQFRMAPLGVYGEALAAQQHVMAERLRAELLVQGGAP